MKNSGFYIVNCSDRPYEKLIAREFDGRLYYIHPDLRDDWIHNPMRMDEAVPVEHFGIKIEVFEGILSGSIDDTLPKIAKYPNGTPRLWQGSVDFIFYFKDITSDSIPRNYSNEKEAEKAELDGKAEGCNPENLTTEEEEEDKPPWGT